MVWVILLLAVDLRNEVRHLKENYLRIKIDLQDSQLVSPPPPPVILNDDNKQEQV